MKQHPDVYAVNICTDCAIWFANRDEMLANIGVSREEITTDDEDATGAPPPTTRNERPMNTEELTKAKRRHDLEMTVSAIAFTMATTPVWDTDTMDTIQELISEVAPHPCEIEPGSYEDYVNDLMSAQLPVSWAMIAEAQLLDREANEENEENDHYAATITANRANH